MDDPDDAEAARRARAHAIWEREGRPEGRHAEHWEEAGREVGGAGESDAPTDAVPPVGSAGEREARGHGAKPIPSSAPANPNLDPATR